MISSFKQKYSLWSIVVVFGCICFASLVYHPKWKSTSNEKIISWDVAGYYQYLPAAFIYKDIKQAKYLEEVLEKYKFAPNNQQVFPLPNGNRVMKYSMGQAVAYFPFFCIGHLWAESSDFLADGFSTPYQFAMQLGIMFYAFLGLWYLRLILLRFFSDPVVALTILGIGIGSNYLEYASITGAMTHNNLFAIYTVLLYLTINFYERPTATKSIGLGLLIGLASLTRPTEIISILIPLLWGISVPWKQGIIDRYEFVKNNFSKFFLMAIAIFLVGMWQLIYWKYVSGDWFVYSYGDEGFDWLKPHVEDCLISMKAGWLVYSPLMILSLVGFYFLYKRQKPIFPVVFLFSILAMYIVFSWQTWWYGGSLGQRALVQYYPVLAFPFAACTSQMLSKKWSRVLLGLMFGVFIYYNIWLTHQVHHGGLVYVSQMRRAYFWKVVGRYDKNMEDLKLLDTDEYFSGKRKTIKELYFNDFESEDVIKCHYKPIAGNNTPCLSKVNPVSAEYGVELHDGQFDWIRVEATFYCDYKLWSHHNMGEWKVRFYSGDRCVKEKMIRPHRILPPKISTTIFFDVKCPDDTFDRVTTILNHGANYNLLQYDDLKIEGFSEY